MSAFSSSFPFSFLFFGSLLSSYSWLLPSFFFIYLPLRWPFSSRFAIFLFFFFVFPLLLERKLAPSFCTCVTSFSSLFFFFFSHIFSLTCFQLFFSVKRLIAVRPASPVNQEPFPFAVSPALAGPPDNMRRGASFNAADAAVKPSEDEDQGNEHGVLLFESSSLLLPLLQYTAAAPSSRPRGSPTSLSVLSWSFPLARSPLVERHRTDAFPMELSCSNGAPRTSRGPVGGSQRTAAALSRCLAESSASPLPPQSDRISRWLPMELTSFSSAAAAAAPAVQNEGSLNGLPSGEAAVMSPVAMAAARGYGAFLPSLHLQSESSIPSQSLLPPPTRSSSSRRTWRLALSAFCLLNGCLAFLFAWMMNTRQTAFTVVAVRRRWTLSERAAATRLAGVYYLVLGLVLLVDRASEAVLLFLGRAGRGMRVACSMCRHAMRRCIGRVAGLPFCVPLLRRSTRRVDGKEALLLPRSSSSRPDVSGEAASSNLDYAGGAVRGWAAAVASAGASHGGQRLSVPRKIRRRGN